MSSGPDDERRQPSEPTFADAMNGFSFHAGRSSRRRRRGRRRGTDADATDAAGADAAAPAPAPPPAPAPLPQVRPGPPTAPIDMRGIRADEGGMETGASAVRPYAWTRGRTKSGLDLAIEALVSTSQRARDQLGLLQVEHRAVAEL